MTKTPRSTTILLVDDDAEDRQLVLDAMRESHLDTDLRAVEDGEALMDYLYRRGRYAGANVAPRPGLILLDLAMPRMSGREVLAKIKRDPELRAIPVVVMTTSSAEADIHGSYEMGASSYVTKPMSFSALLDVMKGLHRYWLEIVELPT